MDHATSMYQMPRIIKKVQNLLLFAEHKIHTTYKTDVSTLKPQNMSTIQY